jgi:hypothetical protein
MKARTLKMSVVVLFFAAVTAFGQQEPINGRAELRGALATASSAADHARIAYYYHRTANEYAQKQAEEEQIAARWEKQYGSWTKSPNPYRSAVNLASYYAKLSSDARTHAREQDKLASALSDSRSAS